MKKISFYVYSNGYKHFWMITLSDWLYNKYMHINKERIDLISPKTIVPSYKKLAEWHEKGKNE